MGSNLSVNSQYVVDEASEALDRKKLIPVKIQNADLPFRFKRHHTLGLLDWDGSKQSHEFRRLVEDITTAKPKPLPKPSRRGVTKESANTRKVEEK